MLEKKDLLSAVKISPAVHLPFGLPTMYFYGLNRRPLLFKLLKLRSHVISNPIAPTIFSVT